MSEHELWNELGKLHFNIGSYDEAIAAYSKAIELNPKFGWPYSNLALAYVQKGKYAEALSLYRRSIDLLTAKKAKAIAWNRLGDIYRQLRDYDHAVAAFQKADELDLDIGIRGESSPSPDKDKGIPLDGQIPEGQSAFDLDVESQPAQSGESPVNTVLAEESHAPALQSPLAVKPGQDDGQPNQPVEQLHEPLPSESIDLFADFIAPPENHPTSPEISSTLPVAIQEEIFEGKAIFGKPEQPMSLEQAPQSVEFGAEANPAPDYPFGKQNLPLVDPHNEVEPEEPAPEFRAINFEPVSYSMMESGDQKADEPTALSQEELDELNQQVANMKNVLTINPQNAFAWDTLGTLYKSLGRYGEAISAYKQAIDFDSHKAFYYYHLGLVYAAQRRYDEAIEIFHKVLELNPDHSLAHATLAGYYRKLGHEAEAQRHIEIARATIRNESEYNLACFEAICGNKDQAIEFLKESINRKQVSLDWIRHDPDLDFVRGDPRYEALVGNL